MAKSLPDLITPEFQETLDRWRAACDLAMSDINKLEEMLRQSPAPAFEAEGTGISWFKKRICRTSDHKPLAELPVGDRMALFKELPTFLIMLGKRIKELSDMIGIPDSVISDQIIGQKSSDQKVGQDLEVAAAPPEPELAEAEPPLLIKVGSGVIRRPGGGSSRRRIIPSVQEGANGNR